MDHDEKQRRLQVEKQSIDSPPEHLYEVIAGNTETKPELRAERRRDRHGRRPHSAPTMDGDERKKCNHRNRKPAPPPPGYQDSTIAPLPKRPTSVLTTSVLEVENNNKIILKVEPIKSPVEPVATNGTTPSDSSTAGKNFLVASTSFCNLSRSIRYYYNFIFGEMVLSVNLSSWQVLLLLLIFVLIVFRDVCLSSYP